MGSLTPVLSLASTGLNALNAPLGFASDIVSGAQGLARGVRHIGNPSDAAAERSRLLRLQQNEALKQLEQQQAAGLRDAEAKAALDRAQIAAGADASDVARRAALRRAVARQRASFGAQGLDTGGDGSNEAVLLGLYNESERDREDRARLDNLRTAAIGQGLENQSRINMLQRQQLQERQKLQRLAERY